MTALARLRTAIDRHGIHEIDGSYTDALTEYQANRCRLIRESWLRQEISRIEKRLTVLHSMKIFSTQEGWSMAVLKRQSFKEISSLDEHRKELKRLLP